MTTFDDSVPPSVPRTGYVRHREAFGGHVAASIDALQQRYLKRSSTAIAALAQLRGAVGRTPGSAYGVLELTHVPDRFLGYVSGDEPSDTEHAKHLAMTLYAVHQQSIQDRPMHRDGAGLGAAISQLSRDSDSPEAIYRRFAALGNATTFDEVVYHLRTLFRQLRDKRIAVDYGLLADDLVALRQPGGHDRVRARWGRDFYRTSEGQKPSNDMATNHSAAPAIKE